MSTKAFVHTELQISIPFADAPWRDVNLAIQQQPGFINKTRLAGVGNNLLDGIDAFDTSENAKAFAIEVFPETAAKMNAAFYTRVFDADITEEASRQMNSPYYD
jgi:hypothetical protein